MSWCNYVHGCHDCCQRDAQVLIVEVKKIILGRFTEPSCGPNLGCDVPTWWTCFAFSEYCVFAQHFNIDNSQPVMHEDADDKIMEDDTV
jgi:hypothetical protein